MTPPPPPITINNQLIMSTLNLGTITLGGKVIVSDPCYEMGIWCQSEIDILPGEYECKAHGRDYGDWGSRVSSLIVSRKDSKVIETSYHSSIGVDSGQAGIFNFDYYSDNQPNDDWYRRVSKITLNEPNAGTVDGLGVVSESGCGDGGYDVFIGRDSSGYVVYIGIQYL